MRTLLWSGWRWFPRDMNAFETRAVSGIFR